MSSLWCFFVAFLRTFFCRVTLCNFMYRKKAFYATIFFSIDKNDQSKQKKNFLILFFMPFYATKTWAHCVPDVFWSDWKYMGSDICHLICLDAQKAAWILNEKQRSYKENKILKNVKQVNFEGALLQKRIFSEFLT